MIGYFTSQCGHPRYRRLICLSCYTVSHHEEGGPSSVRFQAVQNPVGDRCVRAVVKCQHYHRAVWVNALYGCFFSRYRRALCDNRHAYSRYFKSASLLTGCPLVVSHPGSPRSILLDRIADVIQTAQSVGQPRPECSKRSISLCTAGHDTSRRPFRPAGAAHLHLICQTSGDALRLIQ